MGCFLTNFSFWEILFQIVGHQVMAFERTSPDSTPFVTDRETEAQETNKATKPMGSNIWTRISYPRVRKQFVHGCKCGFSVGNYWILIKIIQICKKTRIRIWEACGRRREAWRADGLYVFRQEMGKEAEKAASERIKLSSPPPRRTHERPHSENCSQPVNLRATSGCTPAPAIQRIGKG